MWTKESVFNEASKYTDVYDFRQNKAVCSAASRLGIYAEVTAHMTKKRLSKPTSIIEAITRAKNYSSRTDCSLKDYSAYEMLSEDNKNAIFGPYANRREAKLSKQEIIEIASKFKTRSEFKVNAPLAYRIANKDKEISNIIYELLEPQKNRKYTYIELRTEAIKYSTKQSFKLGSYSHYQAACRNDRFNDICNHMVPGKIATNYLKPMYLYVVKIITIDNSIPPIYKIGITKRPYILDRFWSDYIKEKTTIEVLFKHKYNIGLEAFEMEQSIIKEFSRFKYNGISPLLKTQTSEMFTKDIRFNVL